MDSSFPSSRLTRNWLFLAALTMALSLAVAVTGWPVLIAASAATFAGMLWRLRPSIPILFLIVIPGLPVLALPVLDGGTGAPVAMAALLVWTALVARVWRQSDDLKNRMAVATAALVVGVGAALVFARMPNLPSFSPPPGNETAAAPAQAEPTDADSQYMLALRYRDGKGVDQDDAKALDLAKRAADQGHAQAQTLVGMMYQNGEGVAADAATAAGYYQKAAAQNDPWAQSLLGGMYLSGNGVEQDNVQAYKWLAKAAAQGNAGARSLLEAVEDTFTDEERQEGKSQAEQN